MFEYRWTEVSAGDGPDEQLTTLGAEGWEAVGMTVSGEHFGRTYVRLLLKREVAHAPAALVDVSFDRRRQADRRKQPRHGTDTAATG